MDKKKENGQRFWLLVKRIVDRDSRNALFKRGRRSFNARSASIWSDRAQYLTIKSSFRCKKAFYNHGRGTDGRKLDDIREHTGRYHILVNSFVSRPHSNTKGYRVMWTTHSVAHCMHLYHRWLWLRTWFVKCSRKCFSVAWHGLFIAILRCCTGSATKQSTAKTDMICTFIGVCVI